MEDLILYIAITAIVALILGVIVGRFLLMKIFKKNEDDAKEKAKLILKEAEIQAEALKKDRILEAKEKYLKLKSEFEEDANKKKNIIIQNENKLKQREGTLSKQLEQNQRKEAELDSMK